MKLSDQIRQAILDSGISPYLLAKTAGISNSVLSRFLREGTGLTLTTLDALAEVMGLQVIPTVQRVPRPRKRGRAKKGPDMPAQAVKMTKADWQNLADSCAVDAHENHFSSRRGIWHFSDVDVLVLYDNNPYASDRGLPVEETDRYKETRELRQALKKQGIRELAYATAGYEENPDYSFAMVIDARASQEGFVQSLWQAVLRKKYLWRNS